MKRPSSITAVLAAVCLVLLVVVGLRLFVVSPLPDGAYLSVDGKVISNAHVDNVARLSYPAESRSSAAARKSLIDTLATSQAIIAIAEDEGVSVTAKELQQTDVGFGPGLSAQEKANWRLRVALLHKMASSEAGQATAPSASTVERLAERRRAASNTPEQRSYIEIQTHSKKKATKAFIALAGANPASAASRLSDDPAAVATSGGHQAVSQSMLSRAAGQAVFSARKGVPTQPQRIDGRWRTYLVTEVVGGLAAAPLVELRKQQKEQLTAQAWAHRYSEAELSILKQARELVACAPEWYQREVCGAKGNQ